MFNFSDINDKELLNIINTNEYDSDLYASADIIRRQYYGNKVYIRGLIEITNYCKNNCYYCGIRCENKKVERYRLNKEDILECCREGYSLGFKTFVLQGGEDPSFTDYIVCDIVSSIKENYPDCAVTLSIGEKPYKSYKAFYDAGADRYLLRHETANPTHYNKLHPNSMSLEYRKKCLYNLKEIGYQVGSGFMVGSPFQTNENIIEDIKFLKELSPDMIGIGPYMCHTDTPFANYKNGDFNLTLRLISILRHMFPYALIPSTTALASIAQNGRELGLKAGANVVMPNLSPQKFRELYSIYENKISSGNESAEQLENLKKLVKSVGYEIVTDVGHVIKH